ncbi:arabinan endo-1,5-alpha-L-arabinosidase [Chondrinema litorale]|uniref:arabinan endo-1,5-alpha-L-arabinosidase n=1 Tax=Chondrinema litorale TaxID=2994555 RepID=UPI002543A1D8|nr:arabinan endo-1,5-alpha-L-arabinosidase [Chondrinema litorale]UZR98805.1 arabinan endo-1,5-alpha-L-arabinosidase [Chondrinema litorale]
MKSRLRIIIALCGFMLIVFNKVSAQNFTDVIVHDPMMIKQGDTYFLFCTGRGISVFSSKDLKDWKKEKPVFDTPPLWAVEAVPTFKGHIWAPDISFHNGLYYLYYSVSAFGKNTSCIGVATNKTLDPTDSNFKWIDHGKVIQSVPGRDLWNAIDPNLSYDENQQPWLTFGSFWSGMKLVKMDASLTEVAQPEEWYTISKRDRSFKQDDYNPGEAAVEAPFIFKKNGYYYLFVSFDYCCKGVESTYKVVVGRSKSIKGPFLDKEGIKMDEGGGSLLIEGNKDWNGVGHNSAYTFDGKDYFVSHAYDANDDGKPKLIIREMAWDGEKWPIISW